MTSRSQSSLAAISGHGLEGDVGDSRGRARQRPADRIHESRLDDDTVRRRVLARRVDRERVEVERDDRREPEPRAGDREHAGAAADVEERAARKVDEQLEAEPRRRMRAGAERPGRVDDDRQQPGCGLLPGRARPTADRR